MYTYILVFANHAFENLFIFSNLLIVDVKEGLCVLVIYYYDYVIFYLALIVVLHYYRNQGNCHYELHNSRNTFAASQLTLQDSNFAVWLHCEILQKDANIKNGESLYVHDR